MPVLPSIFQKHLGIIPDNQLKFDDHLKMVSGKISETIGFLRKLQSFLPRLQLSQYIKLLSNPILIMVISLMITRIICFFTKDWNPVSIIPTWP